MIHAGWNVAAAVVASLAAATANAEIFRRTQAIAWPYRPAHRGPGAPRRPLRST